MMREISWPSIAMGIYSYAIALKEGVSFRSSLQRINCAERIQLVAFSIFLPLTALTSSCSFALLWTHSVGIIDMGSYFSLVEKSCFGSFALFYSGELFARAPSDSWKLIGNLSFLAWSISNFVGVILGMPLNPALSFSFLGLGCIAFAQSYLCNNALQNSREFSLN